MITPREQLLRLGKAIEHSSERKALLLDTVGKVGGDGWFELLAAAKAVFILAARSETGPFAKQPQPVTEEWKKAIAEAGKQPVTEAFQSFQARAHNAAMSLASGRTVNSDFSCSEARSNFLYYLRAQCEAARVVQQGYVSREYQDHNGRYCVEVMPKQQQPKAAPKAVPVPKAATRHDPALDTPEGRATAALQQIAKGEPFEATFASPSDRSDCLEAIKSANTDESVHQQGLKVEQYLERGGRYGLRVSPFEPDAKEGTEIRTIRGMTKRYVNGTWVPVWLTARGNKQLLTNMTTSHIKNCLRRVKNRADVSQLDDLWIEIFEQELDRRESEPKPDMIIHPQWVKQTAERIKHSNSAAKVGVAANSPEHLDACIEEIEKHARKHKVFDVDRLKTDMAGSSNSVGRLWLDERRHGGETVQEMDMSSLISLRVSLPGEFEEETERRAWAKLIDDEIKRRQQDLLAPVERDLRRGLPCSKGFRFMNQRELFVDQIKERNPDLNIQVSETFIPFSGWPFSVTLMPETTA